MILKVKPIIHLIISDEDLSNRITSQLLDVFNIVTSESMEHYLSLLDENTALVICQKELLGTEPGAIIQRIKSKSAISSIRVLIMGSTCSSNEQIELLKQGARGYFDVSLSLDTLNEAIQCVLHGEVWIERHVISGLIDELTHTPEISVEQRQAVSTLSPKELEVAQRVSHGATNKMIAQDMTITERTVKAHLTTIFQKMGLADRLSLAILFRDLRG